MLGHVRPQVSRFTHVHVSAEEEKAGNEGNSDGCIEDGKNFFLTGVATASCG